MTDNAAESQSKILIVDDSKVIRWAATKILDKDHHVLEACDGKEAWELLQDDQEIGVVFSDLQMPEMDGYELLERIRDSAEPRLMNMPVVIITSQEDDDGARERILDLGATDFISKPFDSLTLKSRASAYLSFGKQVSQLEDQIEQDKLTGLANKQFFYTHGDKGLALAIRYNTNMTIGLLELDRFSNIIEKFGKKLAAQLLVKISQQIAAQLRREDLAARVETARFALILPLTNRLGGMRAVARICQSISSLSLSAGGQPIPITISAGIASPEGQGEMEFTTLVEQATEALQTASTAGANFIVNAGEGVPHSLDDITTEFVEATRLEEQKDQEAVAAAPEAAEAAPTEEPVAEAAATEEPVAEAAAAEEEPVAEEAAPAEAEAAPASIDEMIAKIGAGEAEQITNEQLAQLMRSILPLINHANKQLELGLGDNLEAMSAKLEASDS